MVKVRVIGCSANSGPALIAVCDNTFDSNAVKAVEGRRPDSYLIEVGSSHKAPAEKIEDVVFTLSYDDKVILRIPVYTTPLLPETAFMLKEILSIIGRSPQRGDFAEVTIYIVPEKVLAEKAESFGDSLIHFRLVGEEETKEVTKVKLLVPIFTTLIISTATAIQMALYQDAQMILFKTFVKGFKALTANPESTKKDDDSGKNYH